MSSISSSAFSAAWEHEYAESNRIGSNYSSNAVHITSEQSPLSELKLRVHTLRNDVERSAALHHKANLTCAGHRRELNMLQEKERALFTANEDRLKEEVQRVLEMNKLLRERLERQKREEEETLQKTLETTRTENNVKIHALEETLNTLQETWQSVKLESERAVEMKSSVERELSAAIHTRSRLEHEMKEMQSKVQSYTDEHFVRFSSAVHAEQEEIHAKHNKSIIYNTNNVNDAPVADNYINSEAKKANTSFTETKKLEKNNDMMKRMCDKNDDNNSSIHLAALPIHTSNTADASTDKKMCSAHIKHDATRQPSTMSENKYPCYWQETHPSSSSSSSFTASLSSSSSSTISSSLEEHELNATPFMYKQPSPVQSVFIPTGLTDSERATLPASHHIASLVSTIKRRNTYLPHSFYARHHIDLHLCQSPFRNRINEIRDNAAMRESNTILSYGRCASPVLEFPSKESDTTNALDKNKAHNPTLLESDDQNNINDIDDPKSSSDNTEMEYRMKNNDINEIHRRHHKNVESHRKQEHGNVQHTLDKVCKTLLYELSCLQCEYAECEMKLCRRHKHNSSNNNKNNSNVMETSKYMRETMKAIDRKVAQLQTLRQLERKLHHTVNIHNTLRSVVKENHYCDEIYSSVLELLRCG